MRFLCSTFGSAGDVFPMLGLALALRQRGHDVSFATNAHYGGVVESSGLPFHALGTEEDFQRCVDNPDLWHPLRAFGHVIRSLQPVLKAQYELHVTSAHPDLIAITNCFGFGAFNARETIGLPVITMHCQPAVLWSDIDPPALPGLVGPQWLQRLGYRLGVRWMLHPTVARFVNPWRAELGLGPIPPVTSWWNSPDGVLAMFPDWYAPAQPDWPPHVMQTDFPLWNHRSDRPLDPEVEDFLTAGKPPIVFTPGSANIHGSDFFRSAVDACRLLGRRAVLLSEFPDQIPPLSGTDAAHFAYVPLDRILPRSAAFVHHGGIGSTSQALLAGIPQVIMPLAHDQFDNLQRITRRSLGAGLPVRRFRPRPLANTLDQLLNSTDVHSACQAAAARLAPRDGLTRSAVAIEERGTELLASRRDRT
ncbi:MAG: glycosyltransferase [Pirellulales bacterium]